MKRTTKKNWKSRLSYELLHHLTEQEGVKTFQHLKSHRKRFEQLYCLDAIPPACLCQEAFEKLGMW